MDFDDNISSKPSKLVREEDLSKKINLLSDEIRDHKALSFIDTLELFR